MTHATPALETHKVLCIAGPTASGKSAIAMQIAQRGLNDRAVELITVDSAQVFRSMDIGTAKPSADEQARVPHHLLDLIDPTQAYSAGQFVQDATAAMTQVLARNAVPVLVGGTMLYYKALLEGLDDLPTANLAIRAQIELEALNIGWPALHAQLLVVDPEFAAGVQPNDSQRISRGLEVWHSTGRALSSYYQPKPTAQSPFEFTLLSLEPADRSWLHRRIEQRFAQMLELGLEEELIALQQRWSLEPTLPAMRCVGYRQMWQYLAGQCSYDQMQQSGTAATRQLAKRQLTWLRSMPQRYMIVADATVNTAGGSALDQALRSVAQFFNT